MGRSWRRAPCWRKYDDTLYVATVNIDRAALQQARATLVNAKANVPQMKAKLVDAGADWRRAQAVGPSQALAATTYDQYKATYETAKSNLALAEAAVEVAVAGVAQAEANLKQAEANLAYCTVKSPVAGVIVDRRVNIGQTIVSSTSTSSLFLIAKDLKRIQVWASVNEADIGKIHEGQTVDFTVDAFGDQVFHGVVNQDPAKRHHVAERCHLYRGGKPRQLRWQTLAIPYDKPAIRSRQTSKRSAGAQRRLALGATVRPAGSRFRRCFPYRSRTACKPARSCCRERGAFARHPLGRRGRFPQACQGEHRIDRRCVDGSQRRRNYRGSAGGHEWNQRVTPG